MAKPKEKPSFLFQTFFPISIMLTVTPLTITLTYYIVKGFRLTDVLEQGVVGFMFESLRSVNFLNVYAWLTVLVFSFWSATAPLYLGGEMYNGPATPNGHRPLYIQSGFRYYCATLIMCWAVLYCPFCPKASVLYDSLVDLSGVLGVYGILVSLLLFIKGKLKPSLGDHDSSGNAMFDFYWGLELHPKFGKHFYLKVWAISHFGMTAWSLVVLVCWKAQYEMTGFDWGMAACALAQALYIGKFHFWEVGYMNSLDITVDRAGYYLVYGCLGFAPFVLPCSTIYLVNNPTGLTPLMAGAFLAGACLFAALTFWIDEQKRWVREAGGNCQLWGKQAKFIRAKYRNGKAEEKENLLVTSGFWSLARHPNYLPEFCSNLAWTLPCGFESLAPHVWNLILFILLIHRIPRNENMCKSKYGSYWDQYKSVIKYKLIYGVY